MTATRPQRPTVSRHRTAVATVSACPGQPASASRLCWSASGLPSGLGMDEIFLDVTGEAKARLAQGRLPHGFLGHLQQGTLVRAP